MLLRCSLRLARPDATLVLVGPRWAQVRQLVERSDSGLSWPIPGIAAWGGAPRRESGGDGCCGSALRTFTQGELVSCWRRVWPPASWWRLICPHGFCGRQCKHGAAARSSDAGDTLVGVLTIPTRRDWQATGLRGGRAGGSA